MTKPSPRPAVSPWHRARRATLACALVAGGATLLALGLPPLLGLFLQGVDLIRSDLGLFCAQRDALSASGSLFVSSSLGNGGALLARPEAQSLYPLRWLLLILGPDGATTLSPALHLAIGAAGAAWLARSFGVRPTAAAAAGIAFAFSGPALNLISHNLYVAGAAWLPIAWAAARRSLRPRARTAHLLAFGGALAALLLASEAQAFGVASALGCLEIVLRRPWSRPGRRRAAGLVAACIPAAFLAGLAPWLPAFAEMALSHRGGALSPQEVLAWAFTRDLWVGALVRGALAMPVQPAVQLWRVLAATGDGPFPWNLDAYVGPLFLAAAGAGLARRRLRAAATVAGVGLLLALGAETPVAPLLLEVFPPLAMFRYPEKYLVVTALAGAVLAAAVLGSLARGRRGRGPFTALAAVVLLLLGGFASWVSRQAPAIEAKALAIGSELPRLLFLPTAGEALLRACLLSAVPALVALAVIWNRRTRGVAPLLLALDLASGGLLLIEWGPAAARLPSVLSTAPAAGGARVFCHDRRMAYGALLTQQWSLESGVTLYRRYWGTTELQACDGAISALPYTVIQSRVSQALEGGLSAGDANAARALGCTTIVTNGYPELAAEPVATRLGDAVRLAKVPDPLPDLALVPHPRLVADELALLRALKAATSSAEALAVVDDPLGRLGPGAVLPAAAPEARIDLRWSSRHRAELTASGSGGAVAFVRTAFLAGWSASQRGAALPVLRAAGNHVAVVVPALSAGPVELSYRPPWLGLGLAASAAGLGLLGLLAWLLAPRRRPNR